jgi:hypothetical protein
LVATLTEEITKMTEKEINDNNLEKIGQVTIEDIYDEWCKRIADSKDIYELINHFREHVWEHFDRHNREGKISLDIWLIGVFNFIHILERKITYITTEDMLFKLCTYYKNNEEGAEPPFNIDEFLEGYDGDIKKFHRIE